MAFNQDYFEERWQAGLKASGLEGAKQCRNEEDAKQEYYLAVFEVLRAMKVAHTPETRWESLRILLEKSLTLGKYQEHDFLRMLAQVAGMKLPQAPLPLSAVSEMVEFCNFLIKFLRKLGVVFKS